MAVFGYVSIVLPEAKRLADLAGIFEDLRSCVEHCDKLINGFPASPDLEAYSTTLVAKYARCFSGGVRVSAQKELETIALQKDASTHSLICGIRDRHLAHSVSDLELHRVRVWLNPPERGGRAVNNVNVESLHVVTLGQETVALRSLASELLQWVQAEMRAEESKLTVLVRQKHTLDELYAMSATPLPNAGYGNLKSGKSRPGP